MKQDFSRYFSKSAFSRRPISQLVFSGVTALAVLVALGSGIGVAAQSAGSDAARPVATATPAPTEAPTPAPTPQATHKPDVVLYMSVSVVQQDIGVELYTLATDEETDRPGAVSATTRVPLMGTEFVINVQDADKKTQEYTLDTSTGTLLVEDAKPGDYTVSVQRLAGYSLPDPETVTVKEKVEYKADVAAVKDKIVQASAVVEAAEDSGLSGAVVAEELTDTVALVEPSAEETESASTLTVKCSSENYVLLTDGSVTPYRVATENDVVTGVQRDPDAPTATQAPAQSENSTPESAAAEEDPFAEWPDFIEAAQFDEYHIDYTDEESVSYQYTGWQTLNGNTYYYDPETHQPVTGNQVIGGEMYKFSSDGILQQNRRGIDVSKFQGSINWGDVKADGIDFAIIRCGYRGYGTGALVEDSAFSANISGAAANGIPVGIYFYSQAVNEEEAVEEASMVISLISGYNISYPVFYDTEYVDGGRANAISAAERTACAVAFCETIRNAGYTPGVYSYASYFYNNLNFSNISKYRIWIAQYRDTLSFSYGYNIWQYSSKGKVNGISGNVDMNLIP